MESSRDMAARVASRLEFEIENEIWLEMRAVLDEFEERMRGKPDQDWLMVLDAMRKEQEADYES